MSAYIRAAEPRADEHGGAEYGRGGELCQRGVRSRGDGKELREYAGQQEDY